MPLRSIEIGVAIPEQGFRDSVVQFDADAGALGDGHEAVLDEGLVAVAEVVPPGNVERVKFRARGNWARRPARGRLPSSPSGDETLCGAIGM